MIRLGVIGLGRRMSGVINDCLRVIEPELQVCGVIDPDEENARLRLSEREKEQAVFCASLPELIRQTRPEALLIGTRCHMHTPYAIEAAQYDLPLYLEKPVAITMEQANGLERAFAKSRCQVVVSFPLRLSPLCQLAKQYIDNDAVGSCEHVSAKSYVHYGTVYWEQEYRNYQITQGLFLQKATHDFDYISYLMGSPIVRVAAMGTFGRVFGGHKPAGLRCSECAEQETCLESPANRKRNCSSDPALFNDHPCLFSVDSGSPQTGTNEDCSSALMEFASGAHGVHTQVFFTRRDAAARGPIISGYHGTLSFDWYENQLKHVYHHKPFTEIAKTDDNLNHFGGDIELAHDFLDSIKGKGQSRSTIWDGLQSVYTCLACKESMQKGTFVNVRQVAKPELPPKSQPAGRSVPEWNRPMIPQPKKPYAAGKVKSGTPCGR